MSPVTSPVPRDTARRWRVLTMLASGVALVTLDTSLFDLVHALLVQAVDSDRYRILWVTGTYLVGGATGMAMTRLWASRFGLRWVYLAGLALFALASLLGAVASDVAQLVPARLASGYGMGLVVAAAMVMVFREFPVRRDWAMALYGAGVYLAALTGPALGALLIEVGGWRTAFLAIGPAGAALVLLGWFSVPDDYPSAPRWPRFDLVGLGLLVGWIVSANVLVDLGQYWGWTNSPPFVIWLAAWVATFAGFVLWGVYARDPLISLVPFRYRDFSLGLWIKGIYSANLFVVLGMVSSYLIDLRGYQWWEGALVLLPALLGAAAVLVASVPLGTPGTRKLRVFLGLATMAVATYWLARVDLYTNKSSIAALLTLWGVGAGIVVVPLMLIIFGTLDEHQVFESAGIFNIFRAIPAFICGAVAATFLARSADGHFDRVRLSITHNRPLVARTTGRLEHHFRERGSSSGMAARQARATLGQWVGANARSFALGDVFVYLSLMTAVGPVLVLFLKRPDPVHARPLFVRTLR